MYRKIVGLALCALLLGAAAACSKDEPVAQQSSGGGQAPITKVPGLPSATGLADVSVTIPSTTTSIDPSLLPLKARPASAFGGLTEAQKICIDDTIYETIKADPSVKDDDTKLATVMGKAMALCGGDAYARGMIDQLKGQLGLTEEQATCAGDKLAGDQELAARFLGSAAGVDINGIMDAIGELETACNFTLKQTG